ncbi:MAG: glycosyltransferase family 9 protein [Deltaproteobacteria bacterium]|nr:glycosyltransferase family 9 protein [Deltaproteobacteria bacterium]MBW2300190.1 glycosyltransferase family 9 protein [Deltaproteobacteria bacterium]
MLIKGSSRLPQNTRNILVIQLGDLGDVVLTIPTLRALRENFPGSRLVVVLREKARGLLEGSPWVAEVVYVSKKKRNVPEELAYQVTFFSKLRKHHFDVSFDLRTGTRGAFLSLLSGARIKVGRYAENGKLWRVRLFTHLVRPENELDQYCAEHGLNILAPFGIQTENRLPVLFVPPEKKERASIILREENVPADKPIIAIQPFSLWGYKEWGAHNYIELIKWIQTRFSLPIVILGSSQERSRATEIIEKTKPGTYNMAGKISVAELPAVIQSSSLLIGGDSVGIHIAAAVGTPTVSLFGPSSPVNWAPRGDKHYVVQKSWACIPCRQKGCRNSGISRCLEELTVDEVIPVVEKQVRRRLEGQSGTCEAQTDHLLK